MPPNDSTQQSEPTKNAKPAAPPFDENRPVGSLKNLSVAMERWRPQIDRLAPKGMDRSRFEAVVMSCAARTPKIQLCSYYSIREAVNAAAELGLELGGVSGEAFLIPYENRKKLKYPDGREQCITVLEATFIPGYKGFLRLAYESGLFRDVGCGVVLPDDDWDPIRRGPDKLLWGHIQNEPKDHPPIEIDAERWRDNERQDYKAKIAPLRGAYAFVKLVNPASDDIVRPIWFARLETIRLRSKAGKNGPWVTDYHEMAQKTAIRNLWKYIPKNDRMKRAEELDQEFEFDEVLKDGREPAAPAGPALTVVADVSPAQKKVASVADRIGKREAERQATPPAQRQTQHVQGTEDTPTGEG